MIKFLFCLLSFIFTLQYLHASHFRGGIITTKPVFQNDSLIIVNVTIKVRCRRSYEECYCDQNGIINQNQLIGKSGFSTYPGVLSEEFDGVYCTDYSLYEDWSYGERTLQVKYSNKGMYNIHYSGYAWVSSLLNCVSDCVISMFSNIDLNIQNHTNRINQSPIANVPSSIIIQIGCYEELRIPVEDADGDIVKCRFGQTKPECGSSCQLPPYLQLDEENCILKFNPGLSFGVYAIRLQIEDFQTINSKTPISSVPLQFIVYAYSLEQSCSTSKPSFEYPTKPDKACVGIPSNTVYNDIIIANSNQNNVEISEIQTFSPPGMIKSSLISYNNSITLKYVNLTWSPGSSTGVSLLCFMAITSYGLRTEQRCISLAVGMNQTKHIQNSMRPQDRVFANETEWTILADKNLTRPLFKSFINFIENKTNQVTLRLDASSSPYIEFNRNRLTIKTTSKFLEEKQFYYILFDYGVLSSDEKCFVNSEEINDHKFWSFYVRDTTPPKLKFLMPPVYVYDSILISWTIDEEATYDCELVYLNNATKLNCDDENNTVLITQLQFEGNYKFVIKATDLENNTAVYNHAFYVDKTPPNLILSYDYTSIKYYNYQPVGFYYTCRDNTQSNAYCETSVKPNEWILCNSYYLFYNLKNEVSYYLHIKCVDSVNLSMSKNITFTFDNEAPNITFVQNITVGCDTSPNVIGNASAVDNLSGYNVTLVYSDVYDKMCTLRRTWTSTDQAGNTARKEQLIIQKLNSSDLVAYLRNESINMECETASYYLSSSSYLQQYLVVNHKCGRKVNIKYFDSNNFTKCNSIINRTWMISDSCVDDVELKQEIKIDQCKQKCSGHGYCNDLFECICNNGWTGKDCSIPLCNNVNNCTNNGKCIDVDKCLCNNGWSANACDVFVCQMNCSNHGQCIAPNKCQCDVNWSGAYCNTPLCENNCNNNGQCVGVNVCVCNNGYTGSTCSAFNCDSVKNCSNNGICVAANQCKCNANWMGTLCNQPICNSLNNCSNHGVCIAQNTCQCYNGWTSSDCSVFECSPKCANNGTCVASNKCSCTSDWQGQSCTIPVCENNCNNKGVCKQPNVCQCYSQYAGTDCSICANNTWGLACNQCPKCRNGLCDPINGNCICSAPNWTGTLCDTCSYAFYGPNCLPLPKITNIIPDYSVDKGNVSIIVKAHNMDKSSSYKCVFGTIEVNGQIENDPEFKLSCITPKMEPKDVVFSLKNENLTLNYDGLFKFIGTCPENGCGENEQVKRGYCRFGKCECFIPFEGDDCSAIMLPPKLFPIKEVTLEQWDSLLIPINIISGSAPIQLTLIEGSRSMQILNSTLVWNKVESDVENINVRIRAKNDIGVDYTSFILKIKPKYVAVLENINKTIYNQPDAVLLSGKLRYRNDTSVRFNESASINLKIRRSFYNDEIVLKISSLANGAFFYRYNPNLNEYGSYYVDAKNQLDSSPFKSQLTWYYLGLYANQTSIQYRGFINEQIEKTFFFNNTNPISLKELTFVYTQNQNIEIEFIFNQKRCTTQCVIANDFKPNEIITAKIIVKTKVALSGYMPLIFLTNEGVYRTINLDLYISEKLPKLTITPGSLSFRISRGEYKTFELTLTNNGDIDAQNLNLTIPQIQNGSIKLNDIQLANNLIKNPNDFNLPLNQICKLFIIFYINDKTPIGQGSASIVVFNNKTRLVLPISYQVASTDLVDLTLKVEDEYTYFASTKPLLADATVLLIDRKVNYRQILQTNSSGMITFYNITEAYYELTISADKHLSKSLVWLAKTEHDVLTVFLERTAVQVTWTVTPTQFVDEYNIVLTNQFQAYVPMPVVTVEPLFIDLEVLETGLVDEISLTVKNHGLIKANDFQLKFPTNHPFLEFIIPENYKIFDVEANTTNVIKIRVQRKSSNALAKYMDASGNCYLVLGFYVYYCGETIIDKTIEIKLGKCFTISLSSTMGKPPTFIVTNNPNYGALYEFYIPFPFTPEPEELYCDDDDDDEEDQKFCDLYQNEGNQPPEPTLSNMLTYLKNMGKCTLNVFKYKNCLLKLNKSKLCNLLKRIKLKKIVLACYVGYQIYQCATFVKNLIECTGPDPYNQCIPTSGSRSISFYNETKTIIEPRLSTSMNLALSLNANENLRRFMAEAFGNEVWLAVDFDLDTFAEYVESAQSDLSEGGSYISVNEFNSIVSTSILPSNISKADVESLLYRLNNTECILDSGSPCSNTVDSNNYINIQNMTKYYDRYEQDTKIAEKFGFENIFAWFEDSLINYQNRGSYRDKSNGICAKVTIVIQQKLTLTRDAFECKLEILNGENHALRNINVTLDIRRVNDKFDSLENFSIGKPYLIKFTSLDGYGQLDSRETGIATWLLIPYKTAAEKIDTEYAIGGTLRYTLDGDEVRIPLTPDTITVKPDPTLDLIYFLEKNVQGDDPFTPEIEPSVPFTLGLLLTNTGYGTANDIKIATAQPVIVDNEKGLLVDFKIIEASLNNKILPSSLNINFGTIKPNETKHVIWSLISTLKGEFINLTATFENKNPNGDPKLSLIDTINYHELDRIVEIDLPHYNNDSLADFLLVNKGFAYLKKVILSNTPSTHVNVTYNENIKFLAYDPFNYLQFQIQSDKDSDGWFFSFIETQYDLSQSTMVNCVRNDRRILPKSNVWFEKEKDTNLWLVNIIDYIDTAVKPINFTYMIKFSQQNIYTPTFDKEIYEFEVMENNELNQIIGEVSGTDLDINQRINFQLLNGTDIASVNSQTGEIKLLVSLDYEEIHKIFFEIQVFDLDRYPTKSSTTKLIIYVQDENDNAPYCIENPFEFNLDTNVAPNSYLFTIHANDLDSGLNGLINYKLANETNKFELNNMTGELIFKGVDEDDPLEFGRISLVVLLNDNGMPMLFNNCQIHIQVYAPNFYAPEIIINKTTINVLENATLSSVIASFDIIDLDNLCCSSVILDTIEIPFSLNSNKNEIIVSDSLDRETIDKYEFILSVTDIGVYPSGSKTTDEILTVVIDDVNDNPPELIPNELRIDIDENLPIDTLIYTFDIIDKDIGINAEISNYTLIPNTVPFYLVLENHKKLMLHIKELIDREEVEMFNFQIYICDAGEPTLCSTADVEILINDLNDNPPQFLTNISQINLLHNGSPLNSIVFTFTAFDPDISDRDKLVFDFDKVNQKFQLDPISGDLRLVGRLDLDELTKMQIDVTDGLFYDYLNFSVLSTANNSYAPIFSKDYYKIKLDKNESRVFPRLIQRLEASDLEGNQLSFSINQINQQTRVFKIDPFSGELYQLSNLEYPIHRFQVAVHDSVILQSYTLNAIANIAIYETERDPPALLALYKVEVAKNETIGTLIAKIELDESDENGDEDVKYKIVDGNEKHLFRLDEISGNLFLNDSLEDEEESEFELIVEAENIFGISNATVLIHVIDLDDSVPIFEQSAYNITINSTDLIIGSVIYQIKATRGNKNIIYDFVSNENFNKTNDFSINKLTGEITCNIDEIKQIVYHLLVSAQYEPIEANRIEFANLTINVITEYETTTIKTTTKAISTSEATTTTVITDTTDSTHTGSFTGDTTDITATTSILITQWFPQYNQTSYSIKVSRNVSNGTLLLNLAVTNENDGSIKYKLNSNPDNLFKLNEETGDLFIDKLLDDKPEKFELKIIAESEYGTATANLIILISDSYPIFSENSYCFEVSSNDLVKDKPVGIVKVNYDGNLIYKLDGESNEFSINEKTGEIKCQITESDKNIREISVHAETTDLIPKHITSSKVKINIDTKCTKVEPPESSTLTDLHIALICVGSLLLLAIIVSIILVISYKKRQIKALEDYKNIELKTIMDDKQNKNTYTF